MKYSIHYNYTTGDSFGSEDRDSKIEYQWSNLEMAEKSLNAINESYKLYQEIDSYSISKEEKEDLIKDILSKDWCPKIRKSSYGFLNESFFFSMYLYSDNGDKFQYQCPWIGYFESLNRVWIESDLLKFNY